MNVESFPLDRAAIAAYNLLRKKLEKSALHSIDESCSLVVECDASEVAISAMLNQGGRPVAFMSTTLQNTELHFLSVKKEVTALIEAVLKWHHLLTGRHFSLKLINALWYSCWIAEKSPKVKKNKIQAWTFELASFCYTVKHRPGNDNVAPDSFTRAFLSAIPAYDLDDIHKALCHPGVTRMLHFVWSKNLPYSTDDVKRVNSSGCRVCAYLEV